MKEVMEEQGGDEICPSAASPEQTGRRRPACSLLHYGCGLAEGTVWRGCGAKITAGQSKAPSAAPGVGTGYNGREEERAEMGEMGMLWGWGARQNCVTVTGGEGQV